MVKHWSATVTHFLLYARELGWMGLVNVNKSELSWPNSKVVNIVHGLRLYVNKSLNISAHNINQIYPFRRLLDKT